MAQYAGQMLPTGTEGTDGKTWVECNGQYLPAWRFPDYFAATTWLPGMTGIHQTRLPNAPGWSVLLVNDPAAPDLPPDTPTAINPPTAAASYVDIDEIADQAAGAVDLAGNIRPTAAVEAASLIDGVEGTFAPMTTTGERWEGALTLAAGSGVQVRARVVGQPFNHHDSNAFTVVV